MQLTEVEIDQITADIFAAILGLTLDGHRASDTFPPDERVVTGVVQITGDFEGAVSVQMSEKLAVRAAQLMFALEADELTEEEVTDTVGELANMTGGNIKSALGGSSALSLPSVTAGRDYRVSLPGTVIKDRIGLDCDGDLVVVALMQLDSTL